MSNWPPSIQSSYTLQIQLVKRRGMTLRNELEEYKSRLFLNQLSVYLLLFPCYYLSWIYALLSHVVLTTFNRINLILIWILFITHFQSQFLGSINKDKTHSAESRSIWKFLSHFEHNELNQFHSGYRSVCFFGKQISSPVVSQQTTILLCVLSMGPSAGRVTSVVHLYILVQLHESLWVSIQFD